MTPIEVVAFVFGVATVYLSARENIWSWPTGMVNVALYAVIFFQERLYADMGLQVIYFALSVYGWYEWLHGGAEKSPLKISRAPRAMLLWLAVGGVAFAAALTQLLARTTNAAVPAIDSSCTTVSLVAQFLMTRKYLENWAVWVAVDIVYVGLFISRGLMLTAVLYGIFTLLALYAWREWLRSWRLERAA